jgi:hypothetical protein
MPAAITSAAIDASFSVPCSAMTVNSPSDEAQLSAERDGVN